MAAGINATLKFNEQEDMILLSVFYKGVRDLLPND
jgi:hypothetical protein